MFSIFKGLHPACLILILFIIPAEYVFAQKSNNIWYFGNNAGLDFNTTPPTALSGSLSTLEGTASISDPAGNLLFYTNGATVWDRNHNVMPNGDGLLGGESSAQAALIIPFPNSCSKYFLFTTEDHYTNGGLHYSIVDLCLNDGLGDIVSGSKNILLYDRTAENLTAVLHANKQDIWIIAHRLNSNQFLSFHVSSTGVNTAPVVSSIGAFYPSNANIGSAKASHDGKKLVSVSTFHSICEMFDFDNATGMLSNHYDFNQLFSGQRAFYGIEFSPNDDLLYLSTTFISSILYQINLADKDVITLNSKGGNYHYGALQMGTDKKIYMARNLEDFLDVIHNPNIIGTACQYDEEGFALKSGTTSTLGLPNFAPYSFFHDVHDINPLGDDTIVCMGSTLTLQAGFPVDCNPSLAWSDGSTGNQLVISSPGSYWVQGENGCVSFSDTIDVSFSSAPQAVVVKEICLGDNYEGYEEAGMYVDTFELVSGCDSIRILNLTIDEIQTQFDITLCPGEEFEGYTLQGVYVDTLNAVAGCDTIRTVDLTFYPTLNNTVDHSICEGDQYLGYSATGMYADTFTNNVGCDSVRVLNLTVANEILVYDQIEICLGDAFNGHNTSGIYSDTFPSLFGCDSINITTLTVVPILKNQAVEICFGTTFENYSSTGIYIDTIPGIVSPCDTIRNLNLTVANLIETTLDHVMCYGETYYGHSEGGLYTDTLISSKGCDSIRTVRLTEEAAIITPLSLSICEGEFTGYSAPGIYQDTFVSISGCDSIRLLELTSFSTFIPNVFSPNNDGINDVFTIFPFPDNTIDLQYFGIFDRYGNMTYETSTLPIKWTGVDKNSLTFQAGVFAYVLIYKCGENQVLEHGNITLVK